MIEHFGEVLRPAKRGHSMTRAMYGYPSRSPHQRVRRDLAGEEFWAATAWAYQDEDHTRHSDAYLLVQRDQALRNFDLSMAYFDSLDSNDFEDALGQVLAKNRALKPVTSLPSWDGVEGVYLMVFDGIKQFYVGQSSDIRKRIKQHWTGRKSFDRLIWGTPYDSIFPVDELRALDNTRIFAARRKNPWALEERVEASADPRFALNRMGGGTSGPISLILNGFEPRARLYSLRAQPASWDEHDNACSVVQEIIDTYRDDHRLASELAALGDIIRSSTRADESTYIWSNRDLIASAAVRGELPVSAFSAYLGALGETVVWPEAPAPPVAAGRTRSDRPAAQSRPKTPVGEQSAARAWLTAHGVDVPRRGRLSAALVARYRAR